MPPNPLVSDFTTLEEEILTTAGTTRFTTAEYPRPAAASDRVLVLIFAGGFARWATVAALNPRKPVTARAVATEAVASQRRPRKKLLFIPIATSTSGYVPALTFHI